MLTSVQKIRGRIAEIGIRHADVAGHLGIHPSLLSAILHGRRTPPEGFLSHAMAVLDQMEHAERAADEARARALDLGNGSRESHERRAE